MDQLLFKAGISSPKTLLLHYVIHYIPSTASITVIFLSHSIINFISDEFPASSTKCPNYCQVSDSGSFHIVADTISVSVQTLIQHFLNISKCLQKCLLSENGDIVSALRLEMES